MSKKVELVISLSMKRNSNLGDMADKFYQIFKEEFFPNSSKQWKREHFPTHSMMPVLP